MKNIIFILIFSFHILFLFISCNEQSVLSVDPSNVKIEAINAKGFMPENSFSGVVEGDTILFPVTVSNQKNLVCVNLIVDNKLVNSDSLYPYQLIWEATLGLGKTIHAEAVYVLGNTVSSNQLYGEITINTSPKVGMNISYPADSTICFNVWGFENNYYQTISKLEIYDNSNLLFSSDKSTDYKWSRPSNREFIIYFNWNNPPGGNHKLYAKGYDNRGGVGFSSTIDIVVKP